MSVLAAGGFLVCVAVLVAAGIVAAVFGALARWRVRRGTRQVPKLVPVGETTEALHWQRPGRRE
ncbi:hypothetical protein LZ318_30960 [Saccharopolyspora indica]|uniref:hypothetical protein n=1 Tax=Saccharopolyspora indica TaxID=1229659 RepID=UPI0022EA6BB3|nr:hypothetical protein [Saccharopolyspora indica]MDA3644346.1 hypothetical protein [Saccharopolyspora indica]